MASAVIVKPKIGRPTDYRDNYPDLLIQYFQSRFDSIINSPIEPMDDDSGRGSSKRAVQRMYLEFPTIAGFANSIETHEQRIFEWSERHPALAEARARVVGITKHLLVGGMLDGRYNAQAAQFVGKNLAGMRDKTEIETTNKVEDSEATQALKRALEHAEPAQLTALTVLIQAMQANAPKVEG